VPLGEVVRQVRTLVEDGTAEVVLTGVDITSYGGDLPGRPALGQMIRRLLAQVPDLKRLRLSSLDAIELDPDLKRLIAEEPRLMPHLHLSLQSGDDMILKRMKRRHSRAEAVALCDELRALRPGIVFGADLIAGFPTESDAMFENSLKLVEDCGLTWLHVFPYSARKGTPAAKMPQLPMAVRKARAARLRAAGDAALSRFLDAQIGTTASVLIEKRRDDGRVMGRSETFAEVLLPGGAVGSVIDVRITGRDGAALTATPLPQTLSPAA
jgi:threonylcarbamoyladenosine tRNA methylthiotransferase MtaB